MAYISISLLLSFVNPQKTYLRNSKYTANLQVTRLLYLETANTWRVQSQCVTVKIHFFKNKIFVITNDFTILESLSGMQRGENFEKLFTRFPQFLDERWLRRDKRDQMVCLMSCAVSTGDRVESILHRSCQTP